MRDLQDMSEEEIEAEIASLDRHRPTEHQVAGGAPRNFAIMLAVLASIGILASVQLTLSTMELLRDPFADLACDINPFIGCGSFLMARQGHVLFGLPNPIVGEVAFAGVLGLAVALLAGARFARWLWWLLLGGVWLASAWIVWFMTQAFFVFHALCPWCVVVWVVMVPILTQTTARAIQGGHLPIRGALGRFLVADRWIVTAVLYALMVAAVAVVYWDNWLMMFSGAL